MRPTLPASRFRVRREPRQSSPTAAAPPQQSRNLLLIPISIISVLIIVAVAAPSLPSTNWISLSKLRSTLTASISPLTGASDTNKQPVSAPLSLASPDQSSSSSSSSVTASSTSNANLLTSSSSSSTSSSSSSTPSSTTTKQQQTVTSKPSTPTATGPTAQSARAPATQPPSVGSTLPTRPVGRRLQQADAQRESGESGGGGGGTGAGGANDGLPQVVPMGPPPAEPSEPGGPVEANLAYFIQISETTVAHLPRLMARLHHPGNVYVIHFDKKVDEGLQEQIRTNMLKRNAQYAANVAFMPSELITYRGVSMLLNTINAMRRLLDMDAKWHYFINLSGADYPMVPQVALRQMLGKYVDNPLNFFTFAPIRTWNRNMKFRLENIYVDDALSFQSEAGEVRRLDVVNPLARSMKLKYTNAEAWMINSRQFCHYVTNSGFARKLLLTFAYSVESSEHYFSTLVWNHPLYNRTIVNDAMRGVIWKFNGILAGQHPYYVDERLDEAEEEADVAKVKGRAGNADGRASNSEKMSAAKNSNKRLVWKEMVQQTYKFHATVVDLPTFFIRKFKHADSPMMDLVDAQWKNATHLKRVREKVEWHVSVSMREHEAKPTLAPSVLQMYGQRRRR